MLPFKPSSGWSSYISTPDQFGANRMVDFIYDRNNSNWCALVLLPSSEEMWEFIQSAVAEREIGLSVVSKFANSGVIARMELDSLKSRRADYINGYGMSSRPYPELRPIDIMGLWRDAPFTFAQMLDDKNSFRSTVKNPIGTDSEGRPLTEARQVLSYRMRESYPEINPFLLSLVLPSQSESNNYEGIALRRLDKEGYSMVAMTEGYQQFAEHPEVFYEALRAVVEIPDRVFYNLVLDLAYREQPVAWLLLIAYARSEDKVADLLQSRGLEPRSIIEVFVNGITNFSDAVAAVNSGVDGNILNSLSGGNR